jgi:hypothetical protein
MSDLDFGDYVVIEMKRHGVQNEQYLHKVIRKFKTNSYVNVPVQSPAREELHGESEEVVSCICCGVDETLVLNYRVKDVQKVVNPLKR